MPRLLLILVVLLGGLAFGPAPRAAAVPGAPALAVEVVVEGLDIPWGLDFAPDGTMYFTERSGAWSALAPPYTGAPTPIAYDDSDLYVNRETGLLDLLVDPDFATNRRVFTCQGHQAEGRRPRVQVISWTISADNRTAQRLADPLVDNVTRWGLRGKHGGCRLRFDGAGHLFVATGDGHRTDNPQDLRTLGGKVLRVDPDTGAGLAANPWGHDPNPNRRRVWTYGHRNLQGLALRPGTTAQMWSVEHGTNRDDEVNRLVPGANYGWQPGPGYDESPPMTDLQRFPRAIPARWSSGYPTVATSGAVFLEGSPWGAWDGALAVAALKGQRLLIFPFAGGVLEAPVVPGVLYGTYGRLRTVVLGPDGALYVTTANGGGQDRILRVTPRELVPAASGREAQQRPRRRSVSTGAPRRTGRGTRSRWRGACGRAGSAVPRPPGGVGEHLGDA